MHYAAGYRGGPYTTPGSTRVCSEYVDYIDLLRLEFGLSTVELVVLDSLWSDFCPRISDSWEITRKQILGRCGVSVYDSRISAILKRLRDSGVIERKEVGCLADTYKPAVYRHGSWSSELLAGRRNILVGGLRESVAFDKYGYVTAIIGSMIYGLSQAIRNYGLRHGCSDFKAKVHLISDRILTLPQMRAWTLILEGDRVLNIGDVLRTSGSGRRGGAFVSPLYAVDSNGVMGGPAVSLPVDEWMDAVFPVRPFTPGLSKIGGLPASSEYWSIVQLEELPFGAPSAKRCGELLGPLASGAESGHAAALDRVLALGLGLGIKLDALLSAQQLMGRSGVGLAIILIAQGESATSCPADQFDYLVRSWRVGELRMYDFHVLLFGDSKLARRTGIKLNDWPMLIADGRWPLHTLPQGTPGNGVANRRRRASLLMDLTQASARGSE